MGQEEPFQRQRLSDRSAPIPVVRAAMIGRLKLTQKLRSLRSSTTADLGPIPALGGRQRKLSEGWQAAVDLFRTRMVGQTPGIWNSGGARESVAVIASLIDDRLF
jgi:hypothetical protein